MLEFRHLLFFIKNLSLQKLLYHSFHSNCIIPTDITNNFWINKHGNFLNKQAITVIVLHEPTNNEECWREKFPHWGSLSRGEQAWREGRLTSPLQLSPYLELWPVSNRHLAGFWPNSAVVPRGQGHSHCTSSPPPTLSESCTLRLARLVHPLDSSREINLCSSIALS